MVKPIVETLPDKPALIERGLAIAVDLIHQAVADHGYCTLALAGGSTPKPLYNGLAKANLPWSQLYIFWGDERYVPVEHPDSNAGMAKQVWLDHVPIPTEQIFIPPTHHPDPATSAQVYQTTIQQLFDSLQKAPTAIPQFDLIFLGMGADGHTASLFPHTPALAVHDQLVTVGVKDDAPRLTFTVPLINHSRHVLFLVAGADKQAALEQVFAVDGDHQTYPSRLIQPQGELRWLLDAQAADTLTRPA